MESLKVIQKELIELGCDNKDVYAAIQSLEEKLNLQQQIERTLYNSELYLVYKHTDPEGRGYIGITRNLPNTRWNEGAGYEKQSKFYRAIQKYGWINFEHEILAAGLNEKEALEIENQMIIQYRSYDEKYGYNTQRNHNREKGKQQETVVVEKSSQETTENHVEACERKRLDPTDIAKKIISTFSIRICRKQIYYLVDGNYVLEKMCPIIEKELLTVYDVPPKKHKDIIERIKILAETKESTSPAFASSGLLSIENDFVLFCKEFDVNAYPDGFATNEEIYKAYSLWAAERGAFPLSKTAAIKQLHNVSRKYPVGLSPIRISKGRGWRRQ